MVYCDTSFLLSLFVRDSGSVLADRQVKDLSTPIVWTPWHELEFAAGLEARIGRGDNTREEGRSVYRRVSECQSMGFFVVRSPRDWTSVHQQGVKLAKSYSAEFNNRGLDVLHVALCEELDLSDFWSRDMRQRKLAEARGLRVNELE